MEIIISNIPLIFRYRSFNINNINALNNDYLWFSDFYAQNDPFDGITEYKWDENDNPLIWEEIENNHPEINKINHGILEKALHTVSPFFSDKNPVLISCFSFKYDDILLWSHYADGHRGFCQMFTCKKDKSRLLLEIQPQSVCNYFDKLIVDGKYLPLLPVTYQEDKGKPLLSSQINTKEGMQQRIDNIRLKYTSWKYEAELRGVVFYNSLRESNKLYYQISSLFGVILGSEIDNESEKLITAICKEKKCHLYKMEKVFGKFAIKPKYIF